MYHPLGSRYMNTSVPAPPVNGSVTVTSFFNVFHWVFQEQRQHLASAFKGLTRQETLMGIVAKTPKVLLLSVKHGKSFPSTVNVCRF